MLMPAAAYIYARTSPRALPRAAPLVPLAKCQESNSIYYRDLLKDPKHQETWSQAAANEYGRLLNGVGKNKDGTQRVKGTNTCHWIEKSQVPKSKVKELPMPEQ
jgi:hypothetical protein